MYALSYNAPMKTKTAAAKKKAGPGKERLETSPVSVRVSNAHLAELAKLIKQTGVGQSAHIQMAISEYLERRRK